MQQMQHMMPESVGPLFADLTDALVAANAALIRIAETAIHLQLNNGPDHAQIIALGRLVEQHRGELGVMRTKLRRLAALVPKPRTRKRKGRR